MNTLTTLALVAAGIAQIGCAGIGHQSMPFSQASLPSAVQVPAGNRVSMEAAAAGDISYECRAKRDMPGQFEWAFVGPDAGMRDRQGKVIGKYYGPPATWEAMDGSRVTGTQVTVAPAGVADIPLQLVKANPIMGAGAMQGTSYIQRVNTRGGVAPPMACGASNAGQKTLVKYSADYIFWRAG